MELGDVIKQVVRLGEELDAQIKRVELMTKYRTGDHPVPDAVSQANATKAYRLLMGMAPSNWPGLIVDSVEERLEVQAIEFTDRNASAVAWEAWQRSCLDADAGLAHDAALTGGRAYAIVWADADGKAEIVIEPATTTIVEYAAGSRTRRRQALRRWREDDHWYATLYRPEGLYKLQSKTKGESKAPASDGWEQREVDDERWPLENPLDVVNVVELAVNRSLSTGTFGSARGEFETVVNHIDRINYAMFSALAAMTWSGFPLRAVIGDPITRDDAGQPIQPFKVAQNHLAQLENPDAKLTQLPEANLKNYNDVIEMHVKHLAALTKTPAHYLLGEMVNLSADAIRAAEAGLVSKVRRHHRSLGEGWEEIARLAVMIDGDERSAADPSVEVKWKDPESRSLAERADAVSKLANILPWQALGELMGASPQQIDAWQAQRGADALTALVAEPAATEPEPIVG